jgi:N-acetylmuramoyl-L-alanine amidase
MKQLRPTSGIVCGMVFAVVLFALAGCGSQPRTAQSRRAAPMRYHSPYQAALPYSGRATVVGPTYIAPLPDYAPGMVQELPAQPAWQAASGKTVILDAGHGGQDAGASHFGLREKDVNLDLAVRTAALLRARGCNVVMTRSSDVFVPLPQRSEIANCHPNAVFVSVHCNASANGPEASGVETFVLTPGITDAARAETVMRKYRADGLAGGQGKQALATLASNCRVKGPVLAQSLQRSLCVRLGEKDRGVQHKDLAVLRETYFGPAALVEVGFMTNPRTAQQMRDDAWRRRTSEALCEGIYNFLQQN